MGLSLIWMDYKKNNIKELVARTDWKREYKRGAINRRCLMLFRRPLPVHRKNEATERTSTTLTTPSHQNKRNETRGRERERIWKTKEVNGIKLEVRTIFWPEFVAERWCGCLEILFEMLKSLLWILRNFLETIQGIHSAIFNIFRTGWEWIWIEASASSETLRRSR